MKKLLITYVLVVAGLVICSQDFQTIEGMVSTAAFADLGDTYILSVGSFPSPVIASVSLINGKLEVIKRYPSGGMYACNPPMPVPDSIEKDIYIAKNGKIVLEKTIKGKVIPPQRTEEKIVFPEEK